jgi:membrane associated rhomboid family serine protease
LQLPQDWRRARVTLWIAGITAAAWALTAGLGVQQWATFWAGFIPLRVEGLAGDEGLAPVFLTPLTCTLVHANFWHLLFNLLFLLICGRSLEPIIGSRQLVVLYLIGAYAAAAAEYAIEPASPVAGIGASGAISAVIGAYAILFGRNRVKVADPRLASWLHALWLLAAWVVLQLIAGLTYRSGDLAGGVAAHIGGFVIGLVLAKPMLLFRYRKA